MDDDSVDTVADDAVVAITVDNAAAAAADDGECQIGSFSSTPS